MFGSFSLSSPSSLLSLPHFTSLHFTSLQLSIHPPRPRPAYLSTHLRRCRRRHQLAPPPSRTFANPLYPSASVYCTALRCCPSSIKSVRVCQGWSRSIHPLIYLSLFQSVHFLIHSSDVVNPTTPLPSPLSLLIHPLLSSCVSSAHSFITILIFYEFVFLLVFTFLRCRCRRCRRRFVCVSCPPRPCWPYDTLSSHLALILPSHASSHLISSRLASLCFPSLHFTSRRVVSIHLCCKPVFSSSLLFFFNRPCLFSSSLLRCRRIFICRRQCSSRIARIRRDPLPHGFHSPPFILLLLLPLLLPRLLHSFHLHLNSHLIAQQHYL